MPVKVKICGVRTPSIIAAAADAGADYVGLVFFPRSLRHVAPDAAKALAEAAKGRIKTVAVMVDPEDALIDQVMGTVGPDMIQLHGGETPERAASIKARAGVPILKAIPVSGITQPRVNKNTLVTYTHTLTPTLYNDFRIGYHRIDFDTLNVFSVDGIGSAGADLGIPGFDGDVAPAIAAAGSR